MINSNGVLISLFEARKFDSIQFYELQDYLMKGWSLVTYEDFSYKTVIQREIKLDDKIVTFLSCVKRFKYNSSTISKKEIELPCIMDPDYLHELLEALHEINKVDLDVIEHEFFTDLKDLVQTFKTTLPGCVGSRVEAEKFDNLVQLIYIFKSKYLV